MYGDVGDDVLTGGIGADYFDCGDGIDVIIDFNIEEGDDRAGNCEEIFQSTS
jgi:Ca2+-binding RTX toxin-like protein